MGGGHRSWGVEEYTRFQVSPSMVKLLGVHITQGLDIVFKWLIVFHIGVTVACLTQGFERLALGFVEGVAAGVDKGFVGSHLDSFGFGLGQFSGGTTTHHTALCFFW